MNNRLNLFFIWLMAISFTTPADQITHSFLLQFGGSAQLKMAFHTSEKESYTEIGWLKKHLDYQNDCGFFCLHSTFFALLRPVPEIQRKLRIFRNGYNLFYELVDVDNDEVVYQGSVALPENAIVAQLPEALKLRSGTSAAITLFDALNYEILHRISGIVNMGSYSNLFPTTGAQISLPANSLSNSQNTLTFPFLDVTYTYAFFDDQISLLQITDPISAPGFYLLDAGVQVANLCSRHLLRITVIVILVIVIGSLSQTGSLPFWH